MTPKDFASTSRHHPRAGRRAFGLLSIAALIGSGVACHHETGSGDDDWDFAAPIDLTVALTIEPQNPVIVVNAGQMMPSTMTFKATIGGQVVDAQWQTDRDEVGAIDQGGLYATRTDDPAKKPNAIGGKALIKATYNGLTGTTFAIVQYKMTQDGDPKCTNVGTIGAGGYAGVGGNGPGCPTTTAQRTALKTTATADSALKWLYPYEATVFPRGLLAPLLQWDAGARDYEAMRIQMASKSGTFVYDGVFSKPIGGKPFINLPIPQATWEKMNISSSGDDVMVTVTLAQGTAAYGPVTINWHIAAGTLRGIVYYNSYGTALVTNSGVKDHNGVEFGAGTLSINPGKTDPKLVAGVNSPNSESGCRVCHSVTKDGSRLITQRGDQYQTSRGVDLRASNAEGMITAGNSAFPALSPTGSYFFTSSGGMINGDPTGSHLYNQAGTLVPTPTLPAGLKAALPSFSPDGKQIVFNYYAGAGSDERSLAVMSFDETNKAFGTVTPIHTPTGGTAVWPSFLPTTTSVAFELEDSGGEFGYTRFGKTGQLWWVDVATKKAHALDKLNGVGYLPTNAFHPADTQLNYEPTVNPVPSGGYAWVVFTSRRMYGNVATQDPKLSDPRDYDWKNNITTKKLWVAAVDLNGKVNTDPSHPAFYLPAQELYAGNSRGFWTVDPCADNGASCETGDQCCGGFCRNQSGGDAGADVFTCSSTTPLCSHEYEKCTKDADCCLLDPSIDPTGEQQPTCINGYCSVPAPTPVL